MAGITVQSGEMSFKQSESTLSEPSKPLNIVILGDFSGRASRGLITPETIAERKLHRVDKDSFDDVFSKLNVSLKLALSDEPVRFGALDDLHPDHLYENIDVFARYRQLQRQLGSTQHFEDAVQALTEEGIIRSSGADAPPRVENDRSSSANLLDDLLSDSSRRTPTAALDVAALIRQTVAPYFEPLRDPKANEYIAALEQAICDVMGKIMHHSAFKALEASWRSVDLLNRKLDSDQEVHIHLLDVCPQELLHDGKSIDDAPAPELLAKRLSHQVNIPGAAKIDVLLLDAPLNDSDDDLYLARYLGALAANLNAKLFVGVGAKMLGYSSFLEYAAGQPSEASVSLSERWQALKAMTFADKFYCAAPGFLLRLPYGKRSNAIDSFAYEELPLAGHHASYLWGNGAYLLVVAQIQGGQRARLRGEFDGTWARIENMPLHVYRDQDNEECITPSAEVFLTSTQVAELEQAGLTPLQSVKNSDQILIERVQPLAHTS